MPGNQYVQTDPMSRFMGKISSQGNGCWLWTGSFSSGYPQFYLGPGRTVRPARWILEQEVGLNDLPAKWRVEWTCGDTACVNLNHLYPLTGIEAFWRNVDKQPGGCWDWMGALNRGGYGLGRVRGITEPGTLAHRTSFHLERGPIPAGLELDHLCHRTQCVNPWHLEPVTSAVNLSRRRSVEEKNPKNSKQLIGA